jgi:hypothetical protein
MCKATTENIPALARIWHNVYQSVPKFCFPYTNLNISFTLVSAAFLISVRLLAIQVMVSVFGWPGSDDSENFPTTVEVSGSASSIVHSSLLCPGLIVAFLSHNKYSPSEHLSKATNWWQEFVDALLQFCTGYMIYDFLFIVLIRLEPGSIVPKLQADDYLFLAHHTVTSMYMTQTRVYQAGHMSAMMCMLIGEFSNPLHNSFMIGEAAMALDCCNGTLAQQLHFGIETAFSFLYLLLRVLVGPIAFSHITWDLLGTQQARENLPLTLRLFWNVLIWSVVVGSYGWIVRSYGMLETNIGILMAEGQQEL